MKLYEEHKNSSTRSPNRCGYCRQEGHNRTECPVAREDWKSWSQFKVPERTQGWYLSRNNPKYWGSWYEDCMSTITKQEAKLKKQMSCTPVVRSAPKCGFCGSKDHNRRNCPEMQDFIAKCVQANYNYRKAVYDHVSERLGITVGSAIKVKKSTYGSHDQDFIGLITDINWDVVNVFTAFDCYGYDSVYTQSLNVKALVDGEEKNVNIGSLIDELGLKDIVRHTRSSYYWHDLRLSAVIAKARPQVSEEWFSAYTEAWTFLAKKRSLERLKDDGVYAHIIHWANRT